jgi:ABC-2 type transport system ATP-binding protein
MEIAREVQERLFPQQMPLFADASVAGACRPAQGVGGDYYDVFPLEDGRLGLAIGDVSGKGISAALLMASLRASLRGVTLDNPRDFAKLMDKVNRLVFEASADNRYATFFFCALHPVTHVLECVNAGHNAPLILRHNAEGVAEILRVEADGPVVGLLPLAPYTEQRIQLKPGDLLVTYTDGISEAMTHDDEEWGEDRMMAAAASAPKDAKADQVLRTIFAQADKFTDPQARPASADCMNASAISCQGLTRRFGGFTAVDDIALDVEAGQFFGFLGPNGAGKSTTIKMLTGLLEPSAGNVRILGEDFHAGALELKRQMGVVPEGMALLGRLTAPEYLRFVGQMYGLDRATSNRRTEELLDFMTLANEPKKLITDFSHGMQKKLALAAAVIHAPKVLFLDEPFEGVDAVAAGTLKTMLQGMIHRGATIFLTSHVLEIVERLCSHVAIIHKGKIVANGSLEELRSGVTIHAADGERLTLEQIFLNTVGADQSEPVAELSWLA